MSLEGPIRSYFYLSGYFFSSFYSSSSYSSSDLICPKSSNCYNTLYLEFLFFDSFPIPIIIMLTGRAHPLITYSMNLSISDINPLVKNTIIL